jgi:hypothetical protein
MVIYFIKLSNEKELEYTVFLKHNLEPHHNSCTPEELFQIIIVHSAVIKDPLLQFMDMFFFTFRILT